MAIIERDVVLQSKSGGKSTIDLPVTRLGNIEHTSNDKTTVADADLIPLVDSADGKEMKKISFENFMKSTGKALELGKHTVKNLVDNWYFARPVNQRGLNSYPPQYSYTIDRWLQTGGLTVSLEGGYLKIVNSTDVFNYFLQRADIASLGTLEGMRLTNSALGKATGSGSTFYAGYVKDNVFHSIFDGVPLSFGSNDTLVSYSYTMPSPVPSADAYEACCFSIAPNSTIYLKAVKVEPGEIQTLARQDSDGSWVLNDPPPDFGQELAKCQRYYQLYTSAAARPANGVDCRPTMRLAKPTQGTITVTGDTYYYNDAGL